MSRPVTGPSVSRLARWSAQMTPYSASVVIRTSWNLSPSATSATSAIVFAGDADLGHLTQVEDLIDFVGGQNLVPLHKIANEHAFLHRPLADLGGSRVADLRREGRRQRRRALDPVLAQLTVRLDSLHAL